MSDIVLRGMTWDHRRAIDPLVSTMPGFRARRSDVDIFWTARPLHGFEFDPVQELAQQFDLIVLDHPFVGDIAATGCLEPLDLLIDLFLRDFNQKILLAAADIDNFDGQFQLPFFKLASFAMGSRARDNVKTISGLCSQAGEPQSAEMVRKGGVEPPPLAGLDPKSSASASSATFASVVNPVIGT